MRLRASPVRFVRALGLILGLTLGGVALAVQAQPAPVMAAGAEAPLSTERARMNQRVFDQVWSEVQRAYYDPRLHGVDWKAARREFRPQALAATDDRALYRVLDRMLDLLDDRHASALAPAEARRQDAQRMRRAVLGVSMRRDEENRDVYRVHSVRQGSPAAEAGIAPGWRLDASRPDAWTPERDVVEGEAVTLAMVDADGAARSVTLTPRLMDPRPPFSVARPSAAVVVLKIDSFEPGLGRWVGAQLDTLSPDQPVILDLRGNPGGRLAEADAVLSCFLPRNLTWATRTQRSGRRIPLRTAGGCGELTGPAPNAVAVLVDGDSRSAAELTPAALQEAGRAVVVGETTGGAVLISQQTRLPDGGRLTLSRSDFVTAGGVRLEKRGVTPDLIVPPPADDNADPVLDAAIAALAQGRATQHATTHAAAL